MLEKRVGVSITEALINYHTTGQWLASLQFCSYILNQRIRLCPEHLFVASDTIVSHRPDLSHDFLTTFCTRDQQPSLVGLLASNVPEVRPIDYVCENMRYVSAKKHFLDGIRFVRSCNAHQFVSQLLVTQLKTKEDRDALIGALNMLQQHYLNQLGNEAEATTESYCQILSLLDSLFPLSEKNNQNLLSGTCEDFVGRALDKKIKSEKLFLPKITEEESPSRLQIYLTLLRSRDIGLQSSPASD